MAGTLRRLDRCPSDSAFGFLVLGDAECAEGFSTETFATWPSRPSIYWELLRPRWWRWRRHTRQSERMGKEIRRRVLHEDRRIRLHLAVIPQKPSKTYWTRDPRSTHRDLLHRWHKMLRRREEGNCLCPTDLDTEQSARYPMRCSTSQRPPNTSPFRILSRNSCCTIS